MPYNKIEEAKKHLEIALGGNMNIATLTPLTFAEIMQDFAKSELKKSQEIVENYGQKHLKNCPNCNIELELSKQNDVHFGDSCKDVIRIHCEKCYYEEAVFSY